MTLSKIEILQRAFHNIKNLLEEHSISCFFFNHSLQLFTTCDEEKFSIVPYPMKCNLSPSELYSEIDNVKCNNITDFSMISKGIRGLNDDNDETETVKIIISDGFHTEYSKPIEGVKSFLHKKFDYAIGLGNHETDFDRVFLEFVGKQFNFHCVTEPFDFGFLQETNDDFQQEYIYLPPKSKFFSTKEIFTEPIEQFRIEHHENSGISLDTGLFYETKRYEKMTPKVEKKKHFLFFIDISGSMDNRILQSSILTNYYKNCNFFIQTTSESWSRIPLYFTQELIFVKDEPIPYNKVAEEDALDTMIRIVTKMEELKEMKSCEKVKYLLEYEKDVSSLENVAFQKYFQKNYYALLTNAEKYYLKLTNSFPVLSANICEPIENSHSFSRHCVICYENEKTELFSCLHFVCCYKCCLETIENKFLPECPICRETISWIGSCKRRLSKCIKCLQNIPSVYSYPSGEILYCRDCIPQSGESIHIPFFFT